MPEDLQKLELLMLLSTRYMMGLAQLVWFQQALL